MFTTASIFIFLTALLHCLFFKLESLSFMHKRTLKIFGVRAQDAPIIKPWAYNQGFYNLFIALGLFYSLALKYNNRLVEFETLSSVLLLIIVGAGLVLLRTNPKKYFRASLIQVLPALFGFIFLKIG